MFFLERAKTQKCWNWRRTSQFTKLARNFTDRPALSGLSTAKSILRPSAWSVRRSDICEATTHHPDGEREPVPSHPFPPSFFHPRWPCEGWVPLERIQRGSSIHIIGHIAIGKDSLNALSLLQGPEVWFNMTSESEQSGSFMDSFSHNVTTRSAFDSLTYN